VSVTEERRLYVLGAEVDRDGEAAVEVSRERIVAERVGAVWLAMFPDGSVREFPDDRAVERYVRRSARRRVGRGSILISEIEYRP
jgi:hypothetical protein